MDSDHFYSAQNMSDANKFDPSTISLNPTDENVSRSLTQKLSIITDISMDSTDYGSPLLSASIGDFDEVASPSLDFDGSKRQQMSYSSYLSGRAQEVAKRRQLIERLEKARDSGVLMCAIPQLTELTLTQLSMVLRRALKSSPGLKDFVSDEVLQHIFEDVTSQTPLTSETEKTLQFPDLPNEPNFLTDHETDVSDEEDDQNFKYEILMRDSCLPDYFNVRRNLISADRFASSIISKLADKQNKLKNFIKNDQFEHENPPRGNDSEANSQSCVRCRPLIKRPKRKLFSVKNEPQLLRSTSPPPSNVVDNKIDIDLDFEHKNMPAINVTNKINVENVMQAYLYRLGTMPPHNSAKNHAAFTEIGKRNEFYGFPREIQSELTNFPLHLKPVHSNVTLAQKRRHDSFTRVEDEADTEDTNYPLMHKMKNENVRQPFILKHPPKLLKSKSVFPIITPTMNEERVERVAPLKIKRSSIQIHLPNTAHPDLDRFSNPFYTTSPVVKQNEPPKSAPVLDSINESQMSQETNQTSPRSSSSSSTESDDESSSSSSSDMDSDFEPQPSTKQDEELSVDVNSAANNPAAHIDEEPIDTGNESDNESSSSSSDSDNDENVVDVE